MRFVSCIIATLAAPLISRAGTSANYSLAPDSVDAGGARGTSASYTANFSAMPGSAGTSASYTLRTGFAGQLLDGSTLEITAAPPTVGENGTRQLSAVLRSEDGTVSPIAAGSIAWSVQSGPLTGISPSGLVTAGTVYQDTLAVARGTWQSFTGAFNLTVLNTLPDNFGAYADDGINDDWQVLYFGIGNPLAGPLFDADGDGFDNLFEFRAFLIPTDRFSFLSMLIAETGGGGHAVTFSPRVAGSTYTLMGSSDLSVWSPVAGTISDAGNVRTILDPAGAGNRRFYRIFVSRN